jgi:hypothetical protein
MTTADQLPKMRTLNDLARERVYRDLRWRLLCVTLALLLVDALSLAVILSQHHLWVRIGAALVLLLTQAACVHVILTSVRAAHRTLHEFESLPAPLQDRFLHHTPK